MRRLDLIVLFCLIFQPIVAWAQDGVPTVRRLSQMGFDDPIIERTKTTQPKDQPGSKPVDHLTPRARLVEQASNKLDFVNSLLVPNQKGVESDPNRVNSLTSKVGWEPMFANSCDLMRSAPNLCDQARALKEVLRRYSGSDDFFDTQCDGSCPKAGERPALKSIEFVETSGAVLRQTLQNFSCHYQIAKPKDAQWLARQVKQRDCVCLAEACLR